MAAPVEECQQPTELTSGDLIGLTLTAETGLLSAAAILLVACLILRQTVRNATGSPKTRPIINTHLDIYMISLLVSDSFQAIGAVMDIRWIRQGTVSCGSFCNAQGALQTLGEPAVAMVTAVIALHTFCVIFFRWTPPKSFLLPLIVIGGIWAYVGTYTGVMFAKHGSSFITPTPYWCWISARYPHDRISQEYVWMWFAAIFSIILYIPLFLLIRGNIEVEPSRQFFHVTFHRISNQQYGRGSAFNPSKQSLKMLLYPASYTLIILPMTIARWIGFANGNRIAPWWTFVAVCIFGLSGIINVLLLTLTRPSILSFGGTSNGTYAGNPGRTTAGPGATASFRFAPETTHAEDLEGVSAQANTAFSVSVHVQRDLYDETLSHADPASPYSPRKTGKDRLVSPIREPVPAFALQDLRDRDREHDRDSKLAPP
ncbi:hypothetical protein BKA62DRAFT_256444 [Auriculariales sp. MPI-PUGE-AT-0066]|nr:hypothetical protein BKA62DRAFT_256444 [Auriculariales sp. MPI-PUGE-AT-0066]